SPSGSAASFLAPMWTWVGQGNRATLLTFSPRTLPNLKAGKDFAMGLLGRVGDAAAKAAAAARRAAEAARRAAEAAAAAAAAAAAKAAAAAAKAAASAKAAAAERNRDAYEGVSNKAN